MKLKDGRNVSTMPNHCQCVFLVCLVMILCLFF